MNGYKAYYRGHNFEVQADSHTEAQKKAAAFFKIQKVYHLTLLVQNTKKSDQVTVDNVVIHNFMRWLTKTQADGRWVVFNTEPLTLSRTYRPKMSDGNPAELCRFLITFSSNSARFIVSYTIGADYANSRAVGNDFEYADPSFPKNLKRLITDLTTPIKKK